MDCLDELKKMDLKDVSEKTHISISEIEALIRKDFSRFSHTKAVGFTKIFMRDFGIDLSSWLKEYEEEVGTQNDGIFVISSSKVSVGARTKIMLFLLFALLVVVAVFVYPMLNANEVEANYDNEEMVGRAIKTVEENKSQDKKTDDAINNEEQYGTGGFGDEVPTKDKTKQQTHEVDIKTIPEPIPNRVFIRPAGANSRLWVEVVNETKNRRFQRIIDSKLMLSPDSNYTIVFGHGYFDLIVDDEVFKSRIGGNQQYRYEAGKFVKQKYIPKVRTDQQ